MFIIKEKYIHINIYNRSMLIEKKIEEKLSHSSPGINKYICFKSKYNLYKMYAFTSPPFRQI